MNIIHSFWSKPAFAEEQDFQNSRHYGGWPTARYLLLSSCYSCMRAKKHYKSVELYTDNIGHDLLINWLDTPYSDVHAVLNRLDNTSHQLWVLGKFEAFKRQKAAFIHIDNDVYLWDKLPNIKSKQYLMAQSRIQIPELYKSTLSDVLARFRYIPEEIKTKYVPEQMLVANAGIIGGNDIDFFQRYCDTADKFITQNSEKLELINVGLFNTILDEYLFTCMAKKEKKDVHYMFRTPVKDGFKSIMCFNLVPFLKKYVHLIGNAKTNAFSCEQIEIRFAYEFPLLYRTLNKKLSERFPNQKLGQLEDRGRYVRLMKMLSLFYKSNLATLLKMKIQLIEGVEILSRENSVSKEVEYRLYDTGNARSSGTVTDLSGMDELLIHFETPITLNELIESLREESKVSNRKNFPAMKDKLIDFVTEKIIIEGILKFV